MARIERATSPLPRECSTTEPHGHRHRFANLAHKPVSTTDTKPELEREAGIEPALSAWKAEVLPLNYSRLNKLPGRPKQGQTKIQPAAIAQFLAPHIKATVAAFLLLHFAWWRRLDSNQRRRKPTDLQSAPFSHSGTPPKRASDFITASFALQAFLYSCQSIEPRPFDTNQPEARLNGALPRNGTGGRRADNGEGWFEHRHRCAGP